jgi:hypothetical protein
MKFRNDTIGEMAILHSYGKDELVDLIKAKVGDKKIIDLQYSTIQALNGKPFYTVFVIIE